MTINYINIGSSANKGDGDTLRTAFRKINENFAFLSTATGFYSTGSSTVLNISATAPSTDNGTLWFNTNDARTYVRYNGAWVDASPQVTPPPTTGTEAVITIGPLPPETGEGSLWFNENDARTYINYGGSWIDSSPQVLPPPTLPADDIGVLANDGNGNLYWTTATISTATVNFLSVQSSILPSENLTYDLGSLTKQWRSLYVGTSTIYIGGVAVSINTSSNTLVIGTSTNAVNVATEDYVTNIITSTPTGIALRNYEVLSTGTNNFVIAGNDIANSTVTYDFKIHGTVVGANIDYVTITVGPNPISEIYLTRYVSSDTRAFFAVQEGSQWTIPQDQVTPEMLAYGHFGPANLNANILTFNNMNAVLQANTTYTFWIQQTGAALTEYVFSTVYGDTSGSPNSYSSNPLSPTTVNPTVTVIGGELDPTLTLVRGYKYLFDVTTPGHNFWIMTTSTYNSSAVYTHGVTNNGTGSGVVSFTVPAEAPSTLYYMCDQHAGMSGVINIIDLGTSSTGDLSFIDNTMYNSAGVVVSNRGPSTGATAQLTLPADGTGTVSLLNYYGNIALTSGISPGNTRSWIFNSNGTIQTPSLLPRSFTAVMDSDHMVDAIGFTESDWWSFVVEFQVNSAGDVETVITNNTPWPSNPGYVSGHTFRFTEADHGVPGYTIDISLVNIQNAGGAGFTTNLEVTQPPSLPATIKAPDAIKLTADATSLVFSANGTLTIPTDGTIQSASNNLQITGQNYLMLNSGSGTGQIEIGRYQSSGNVVLGGENTPTVVDGDLTVNGTVNQNNSWTRTTAPFIDVGPGTVVWTSNVDYISSAKLTIQVECNETGDASGWHSQACEAIIACRGYANTYGGPGGDPQMIVYGVVHTSVDPLVTFTVQRNPTTKFVEVVGTLTAAANSSAALRIHSVEMSTRD